ncbi:hypothetical protein [Legionella sp. 16cNR16C]|uniref:hypothetical protein n=1 Tax=Legionella sp. 16cNR16C TaxID=2905656 RepID=UPI001E50BA89|nr:hypothetical protein [Legionella sp. 16cNR16C]MCE3044230.1 hypothetical protein [Legionella sp. 16cNR16C]
MRIPFAEPVSPRYIHIKNRKVHLLVPVVGGEEISTDNTCKSTMALRDFFDGGAIRELNAYKNALIFDIGLLKTDNPLRQEKEDRLAQIESYIEALSAMRYNYIAALNRYLMKPSNLYSIQLRPKEQNGQSRVVNPAFSLIRKNDASGMPLSPLFNAMHETFPNTRIGIPDPRLKLSRAVLSALPESPGFEEIASVLTDKCKEHFKLDIDFTVEQQHIDVLMGFGPTQPATTENYIDALLGKCAPDMWVTIPKPASPFYSLPAAMPVSERTEHLSIITQFFLGNLNMYCKAKGTATENFGAILDASSALSKDLVAVISNALGLGENVEKTICVFCNAHRESFKLSQALNDEDVSAIQQKFERTWRIITATKENPYFDDLMLLDKEATGKAARFVTHQGSICVNFAEIVDATAAATNPRYFAGIRADFEEHSAEIPGRNEGIAGEVDVDLEKLVTTINEEQIKYLPQSVQTTCRRHPDFQVRQLLQDVAKGRQDEAEALLTASETKQALLQTPGAFTDYSGRTFYCTAYEYAYWAKDRHMQRMLESHMDENTKAQMLIRIDSIEANGLRYQQNGREHCSAHFDFTPLKKALQVFVDGNDRWYRTGNWRAIRRARLAVGKAQRDVPAHVAQEYCRTDRSFHPTPSFNEITLPRVLKYNNCTNGRDEYWFPLRASDSGLGFDFAFMRDARLMLFLGGVPDCSPADIDLAAIIQLDKVRTADLTQSRENLLPPAISPSVTRQLSP